MATEATLKKMSITNLIRRAAHIRGSSIDDLAAKSKQELITIIMEAQNQEEILTEETPAESPESAPAEAPTAPSTPVFIAKSMKIVRATIRRYVDKVLADSSARFDIIFQGEEAGDIVDVALFASREKDNPVAIEVGNERAASQRDAYRTIGQFLNLVQAKEDAPAASDEETPESI